MLNKRRTCALAVAAFAFAASSTAELNDSSERGGGGFCRGQTSPPRSRSPEEEGNLSCERVQNCKALGGSQSPSIAIRDSNGRLGNQMFVYQLLLSLRMQFGYRTYITRRTHGYLSRYFDNIDMEVAEDVLCEFEGVHKDLSRDIKEEKMANILRYIERQLGREVHLERDGMGRWAIPHELVASSGIPFDQIVHSKEFGQLSNEIVPRPSAIPWEVFAGDRRLLDLGGEEFARGRALILYPEGLPRLEGNETAFINSAPNLADALATAFAPKKKFLASAAATLSGIAERHRTAAMAKGEKKRRKRKADEEEERLLFVGIHARMTDHKSLERETGRIPVKASYFVQAMDLYRRHFNGSDLIFVYVSDDMEWGKRALAPRNSLGDLYFASEGRPAEEDSIGHDLAVMSLCNHTILTYGTFSHWAGFLAGGSRVLPMHFPEYRTGRERSWGPFLRHPLEHPLPRLQYF